MARGVNQQVRLELSASETSETVCDITYKFKNYFNQKALHKKKLNNKFLE
jgi:hypothetical protein